MNAAPTPRPIHRLAGLATFVVLDVGRDIARLYGPSAAPIQIALTADTDNTGESARAGFADLHWVAASSDCEKRPT